MYTEAYLGGCFGFSQRHFWPADHPLPVCILWSLKGKSGKSKKTALQFLGEPVPFQKEILISVVHMTISNVKKTRILRMVVSTSLPAPCCFTRKEHRHQLSVCNYCFFAFFKFYSFPIFMVNSIQKLSWCHNIPGSKSSCCPYITASEACDRMSYEWRFGWIECVMVTYVTSFLLFLPSVVCASSLLSLWYSCNVILLSTADEDRGDKRNRKKRVYQTFLMGSIATGTGGSLLQRHGKQTHTHTSITTPER